MVFAIMPAVQIRPLLLSPLLFWGCAPLQGPDDSAAVAGPTQVKAPGVRRVGVYLEAVGRGRPDPSLPLETQRRSGSRDAAILDARGRLSEYLRRLPADGKTVGQKADAEAAWRERLQKALAVAEILETRWNDDGTATARLRAEESTILEVLGVREK